MRYSDNSLKNSNFENKGFVNKAFFKYPKIIDMNIRLLSILVLLIALITMSSATLTAQNKYYTKSNKAIKKFEEALHQYNLKNFEAAKKEIADALLIDNQFLDSYILLGEIANEENQKSLAIDYYTKAISIKADYNALMYLRKADLEKETGKYAEAREDYQKFLSYEKKKIEYTDYVNLKMKQCDFAIELIKNPVKFNPINLGPNINTPMSDYWPSLTADNSMLVYTSSDREHRSQEDLYYSIKKNNEWQLAKRMPEPINSDQSEGAQTISADGKTKIFTACLRKDSYGSCDLYISEKKGKNWSNPVNMGSMINSASKESQPCLSSDGKTLYFVSNRPGGKGKFDIWMSQKNENKKWGQPINLGDSINTKDDELAPFIHYDNKTLYFTSEGHLGMGGSDLFISRINENGEWTKAVNVGYPINTYFDEESMVIDANGEYGLVSSNKEGGFGQKDIYQFEVPPSIRPEKTIFIKGIVYNAKTNQPLASNIFVSNIIGNKVFETESDELNGEFLICLPPKSNYAFNVDKPGFMIFSENFALPDSGISIKIPLQPIEIGQLAVLRNIFFEFNSYELKKESFSELNKIIKFIKLNKLSIEIQGHTDNQGTETYNQKLSENRAKTVYDYLIKGGLDKKNLKYKGYGFSQPIASNDTPEGQSQNRRTSIKIIAIN